jgi:hypothetical protein
MSSKGHTVKAKRVQAERHRDGRMCKFGISEVNAYPGGVTAMPHFTRKEASRKWWSQPVLGYHDLCKIDARWEKWPMHWGENNQHLWAVVAGA